MANDSIQIGDVTATQVFTATGNLAVVCSGLNSVGVTITGSGTGTTYNFEGTNNDADWFGVYALNESTGVVEKTVFSNGFWTIPCGGKSQLRVSITTISGGTTTLFLRATFGNSVTNIGQLLNLNSLPTPLNRVNANQSLGVLNASASFLPIGIGTATLVISGTWVGRIQFSASADAGIFGVHAVMNAVTREIVTSTTANGTFLIPAAGYVMLLAQMIAYTSGTATLSFSGSAGESVVNVIGPLSRGRNVKCLTCAASFRVVGNSATPQNIFSIENGSSSAVLVALREIELMCDSTAAQTKIFLARLSRSTALPTGGTALSKGVFDTAQTSDSNVIFRSGASADGTNSAITATAGTTLYEEFIDRPQTAVGYYALEPIHLLPGIAEGAANDPVILRAGEAVLVQIMTTTGADNVSTISYACQATVEEFLFP